MEKVKLTREQANALESLLEDYTKEEIIKENFNPIERLREYLDDENKNIVFRHLSDEMLVKALYFGYEVEEQYKKGDWVKAKDDGRLIKLIHDFMVEEANGCKNHLIEPATEDEISVEWWMRNGREHWELRYNDILIDEQGNLYSFVEECGALLELYSCHVGGVKLKSYEELQDNFQIVCFAEDRKDR